SPAAPAALPAAVQAAPALLPPLLLAVARGVRRLAPGAPASRGVRLPPVPLLGVRLPRVHCRAVAGRATRRLIPAGASSTVPVDRTPAARLAPTGNRGFRGTPSPACLRRVRSARGRFHRRV